MNPLLAAWLLLRLYGVVDSSPLLHPTASGAAEETTIDSVSVPEAVSPHDFHVQLPGISRRSEIVGFGHDQPDRPPRSTNLELGMTRERLSSDLEHRGEDRVFSWVQSLNLVAHRRETIVLEETRLVGGTFGDSLVSVGRFEVPERTTTSLSVSVSPQLAFRIPLGRRGYLRPFLSGGPRLAVSYAGSGGGYTREVLVSLDATFSDGITWGKRGSPNTFTLGEHVSPLVPPIRNRAQYTMFVAIGRTSR